MLLLNANKRWNFNQNIFGHFFKSKFVSTNSETNLLKKFFCIVFFCLLLFWTGSYYSLVSNHLISNELHTAFKLQEEIPSPIKKGLLWQQKDKFFSRWKERFFVLTDDYLQCFKKENSRISEMGSFLSRVKV